MTTILDQTWTPDLPPEALFSEKTWLAGIFITAVGFGAAFTLGAQCFHLLYSTFPGSSRQSSSGLRLTKRQRRNRIMWMGIVLWLIVCSAIYAATGAKMTEYSFITYRNYPGGPSAFEPTFFSLPVNATGNVFFVLANWTCDAILVWRYTVIFHSTRIPRFVILFIPCAAYAGSIALGILWLTQITNLATSPWTASTINFTVPYLSLSLGLNIFLSLALILRLLLFRWRITKHFPGVTMDGSISLGTGTRGTGVGKTYIGVIAMIVESALLYSCFSLLSLVPFILEQPIQNVFNQPYAEAQIIATFMIIYRVASGKAWSANTSTELFGSNSLPSPHNISSAGFASNTRIGRSEESLGPKLNQDSSKENGTYGMENLTRTRTYSLAELDNKEIV